MIELHVEEAGIAAPIASAQHLDYGLARPTDTTTAASVSYVEGPLVRRIM